MTIEIPRIYTSIAEVMACLIYIIPLKKRHTGLTLYLNILVFMSAIIAIQLIAGTLPIIYWIPGMVMSMSAMYFFIYSVCDLSMKQAGLFFIKAFLLAEFAAAIEWQFYYYLIYKGVTHTWILSSIVMISVYTLLFTIARFVDAKKALEDCNLEVSTRDLINAVIIGLATFSINNINFIVDSPFVVNGVGANIMYLRTLIDLSGLLVLFAWNEQRREMHANHEIKAINHILRSQYDQYQRYKDSVQIINRKYHDLKHQIALIRSETDSAKKEEYLREFDYAVEVYGSQYDTGNSVLDTILTGKSHYCKEHDIKLSCIANGELLDFMLVMDVCSIFGNALDNCIECVETIDDINKRIIRVVVFEKNNYLMMRFENYFEQELIFKDGLPETTKSNNNYHGFGIKSIKKTIEKYDGNLTIKTDNNWFVMKILISLSQDNIKQ